MAVSDYSTTPSLNTSISGINIGEGCAPANINNAIRQMMADVKGYDASQVPFTAGDGIAATNVQAAIVEAKTDAIAAIPGAATTTTPGLMSAADKTKLNGIATEAGVTAPIATEAQAQAGSNDTATMTPLRVEQHMLANALGWGQTWQIVTRTPGVDYQNTTGKPIMIAINGTGAGTSLYVGPADPAAILIANNATGASGSFEQYHISAIIPAGHFYRVEGGYSQVAELR